MSEASGTSELNFKEAVLEWMRINDEISQLQTEVRQRRSRSTHLGNYIVHAMKDMNKELCNVGEKALQLKQRKTTTTLKKEDVIRLLRKMTSEETARRETDLLFDNRVTKVKDYIQLIK
jgi:hypothetical protein